MALQKIILFILVFALVTAGAAAANFDSDQLYSSIHRLNLNEVLAYQEALEDAPPDPHRDELLTAVYSFLSDYYLYFTLETRRAEPYTELTIAAAENRMQYNNVPAAVYALYADAYAKKITGAISGIRFGGRVSDAVAAAEALDPDSEELLFVQAKRYLLAPTLAGGDRSRAVTALADIVARHPDSAIYLSFYADSLLSSDREQAEQAFRESLILAPDNPWARRVLAE